jgi:uncharacterized protein (DUF1697 family)
MKINYDFAENITDPQYTLHDDGKTLLALLEDDPFFESSILKLRKKYNIHFNSEKIPETQRVINACISNYRETINNKPNPMFIDVSNLGKKYKLAVIWNFSFFSYIFYNLMLLFPDSKPISVTTDKKLAIEFSNPQRYIHPNNDLYIAIRGKTNKTKIIRFISNNWDTIDSIQNEIGIWASHYPKLNIPNLDTYRLIHQLKKEGKKSPEIATILTNKYWKAFSDSAVRDMYSEYLRQIRNLRTAGKTK